MADSTKKRVRLVVGIALSILALLVTVGIVAWVVPSLSGLDKSPHRRGLAYLLVGWAVVPPAWFLIEWALFSPADPDGAEAKRMIRSQELASKIWAGVLAALGILYAVKAG